MLVEPSLKSSLFDDVLHVFLYCNGENGCVTDNKCFLQWYGLISINVFNIYLHQHYFELIFRALVQLGYVLNKAWKLSPSLSVSSQQEEDVLLRKRNQWTQ